MENVPFLSITIFLPILGALAIMLMIHGDEEKIRSNTRTVLENATTQQIPPRQAALELAEARVRKAMALRRRF